MVSNCLSLKMRNKPCGFKSQDKKMHGIFFSPCLQMRAPSRLLLWALFFFLSLITNATNTCLFLFTTKIPPNDVQGDFCCKTIIFHHCTPVPSLHDRIHPAAIKAVVDAKGQREITLPPTEKKPQN